MKIRILDQAKLDLLDGFEFYEQKEENLGDYFLDSLYSDIDSLAFYAGVHPVRHGFYWYCRSGSPTLYITQLKKEQFTCMPCLIAGRTPNQSRKD